MQLPEQPEGELFGQPGRNLLGQPWLLDQSGGQLHQQFLPQQWKPPELSEQALLDEPDP